MSQKPTVGRIVHLYGSNPELPIAAIVTALHGPGGTVNLTCFPANGGRYACTAPFSETPKAGHWSWPPREGPPPQIVADAPTKDGLVRIMNTFRAMDDAMATAIAALERGEPDPDSRNGKALAELRAARNLGLYGQAEGPEPSLGNIHKIHFDALVAEERRRQMLVHGFDAAHDDKHTLGEIAAAAAAYANWNMAYGSRGDGPPPCWPWDSVCWKPSPDPVRNAVKAAALLQAEGERLLRAAATAEPRVGITVDLGKPGGQCIIAGCDATPDPGMAFCPQHSLRAEAVPPPH